jgi:hypothetical protein
LASSQTITLSWGAKKKERIEQRRVSSDEGLQVGNHVIFENHGNQWAHQAQIIDIDRNCNVLPIYYDPLIVMFVSIQYLMLNKIVRACLF